MKSLLAIASLTILLGSRCASHNAVTTPITPITPTSPSAATLVTGPAILEADVEGIGKATITGQTILVKLPAGYTKSTVRLTYKVTADVKKITPASGTDLPIRAEATRTVCIQNDALGNCTLPYQLVIQAVSDVKATLDPASQQLDVTQYLQPYGLAFQLSNLNTQAGTTRRFQLRFVHKATGYTYVGENYSLADKAGMPIFAGQVSTTMAAEGKLSMTGTLPLDMPTGEYALSVLMPTCYSPTADGRCLSSGIEGVDLTQPFVLRPGPPLVGEVVSSTATAAILIKGRNFSADKPVTLRLSNDFTPPATAAATVESEFLLRATAPASLPGGQYRLDITSAGSQPYASLFVVPTGKVQSYLGYVGTFGSYAATQNWLPTLPAFKGGETLEVRYANQYNGQQTMKALRLINTKNDKQTYELTGNQAFRPFSAAPDFMLWKWTLPTGIPPGTYALVFEDANGVQSVPYYQAIQVQ